MSQDQTFDIAELNRRLANLIAIGTVEQADYDAARYRVRIGDLLTGWLPHFNMRAGGDTAWWALEIGEQVIVLSPSGEPTQGAIVGSLYSAARPANADAPSVHRVTYADGAVIEYNRAASRLRATLPAGGTVEIVANGGIAIDGDVTVTGDVVASGVSLVNHLHTGVVPGGGNTGEPVK